MISSSYLVSRCTLLFSLPDLLSQNKYILRVPHTLIFGVYTSERNILNWEDQRKENATAGPLFQFMWQCAPGVTTSLTYLEWMSACGLNHIALWDDYFDVLVFFKAIICICVFVQRLSEFVSLGYSQSTVVESCVCQSQVFNMELSGWSGCCSAKPRVRNVFSIFRSSSFV